MTSPAGSIPSSRHSSEALMAFSPEIAPPERFRLLSARSIARTVDGGNHQRLCLSPGSVSSGCLIGDSHRPSGHSASWCDDGGRLGAAWVEEEKWGRFFVWRAVGSHRWRSRLWMHPPTHHAARGPPSPQGGGISRLKDQAIHMLVFCVSLPLVGRGDRPKAGGWGWCGWAPTSRRSASGPTHPALSAIYFREQEKGPD